MPRAKRQEVAPEPETVEAATEETQQEVAQEENAVNTGTLEVKETTVTAPVKTVFEVYGADGGVVRTYSVEVHGENAEALANEFISHNPGMVIR